MGAVPSMFWFGAPGWSNRRAVPAWPAKTTTELEDATIAKALARAAP
jgi:hypothetical protein